MVKLSCKQFSLRFAFFVHSIFQLGKRILTFISFIKEGTKTVKCRPLFCILWTFSSFFTGDPTRKVSYIALFTILCFCCHQINGALCPRKNSVSSFIFSFRSSGNFSVSHFNGSDFINFPPELGTFVPLNPCASFFITE